MHDVMISYSRKDKEYATMVLAILEQNNIKCWIDYRDAVPGDDFAGSIVRAIKMAKFMVVLLSSNSIASSQVVNEINAAVNNGVAIIPFKMDESSLSDNMEYYLSKTHWLDAITPPLEKHIKHLAEVIKKNVVSDNQAEKTVTAQAIAKGTADKKVCRMMKLDELFELGYTPTTVALQLVENDYINCNGITEENEGTAEQWESFLQDNSETFQYLVNGENKIVGDWSIVALTDEAYEKAMKGELLESELGVENTEMICFPDTYNGYILTFSILPQYRTAANYNLMIESFIAQIEEYSENEIFFSRWCMNVFGREVEAMIKRLGFEYVCDNKVCGKIYSCSFSPLPEHPLLKKHTKLVENYAKK